MTSKNPRPPRDLGRAGRRFWADVLEEFELSEAETRLLAEAARTIDELERLREAVLDVPAIVAGSTGQDRVHPAYEELRRHRATLAQLLAGMALPAPGEDVGQPGSSLAARRAAQARWGRRG